jgi:VWFA-related protein
MQPAPVALAIGLLLAAGALPTAQVPRGVPRGAAPEEPQREDQRPRAPVFRAAVTRVEISALVLDRGGKPVRGLMAADFEVLENGVPQVIRSFTPFTYDPELLVLPDPVLDRRDAERPVASVIASNFYTSASRVFALILDDLHIDVRRTQVARAAARRLVDQLAPTDLLFVTTTSASESTGFFTRDRTTARRLIDQLMGQRLLDRTIGARRFPGHDEEAGRLDHYQRLCASIRDVSLALRDMSGRRKTVILLSEGSSFGAGMSAMLSRQYVPSGTVSVMQEALAAAAAGNVAIYPLNPAGLDTVDSELMSGFGMVSPAVLTEMLTEARQAKEMMRDFAALTGGVSLVDTNDTLGGIDAVMRDASSHYVLTYEPVTPPKPTEHRTIEVRVRRPDVRVLARRGYGTPSTKPVQPMKVPESLSPQLRALLAGVMPDDGLPMRVQAVPVSRSGKMTSVAVIIEVNGTVLGGERPGGTWQLEQGLLTVNSGGKASNGTRRTFNVTLSPVQWQILTATGLRSVWGIDLPKGRHQVRVASIHPATGRAGSVYLDVDVSEDSALPPGALIASRVLSRMPTVFADQRLSSWTAAMPTATRVFPEGDVLTVTAPHASATPATAHLTNAAGQVLWQGTGERVDGLSAVRFVVPLEGVKTPVCDLIVDTSHGRSRTTIGIVSTMSASDLRPVAPVIGGPARASGL